MTATTIDELQVEITAMTSGFKNQIKDVQTQLNGLDNSSVKTSGSMEKLGNAAKVAFLGAGVAAVAGIGAALNSTSTYESSLSQLKQASGATTAEMEKMSQMTRQLGQDNDLAGVSASDAALAMVELAKAGLSVGETMDATKGVMSLAKAGNIAFADAATIAASALNAFGLKGADASKVADMLAAGANASQAELGDLAAGLQQSATVAKQFGLEMNETVTALALFANNGIKGSDAGTSLKTMLIALAKPSSEAAQAMKDIGFEAYNANGEFVGLEEMSKRLKKATEGLTDEQKQNTLATIFGTDAFRAAAVLADNAGESYNSMSTSVGKVNAAQEAAAAQSGALKKSWESFTNTIADIALSIGQSLSPAITAATSALIKFVGFMVQYKDILLTAGTALTAATVALIAYNAYLKISSALTTAWTAISAYMTVVTGLQAQGVGLLSASWAALNTVMKANVIGIIIVAVAALVAGLIYFFTQTEIGRQIFATAMEAIKTAAEVSVKFIVDTFNSITGFFTGLWRGITDLFNGFISFVKDNWVIILLAIVTGGWILIVGAIIRNWDAIVQFSRDSVANIIRFFSELPGNIIGFFQTARRFVGEIWSGIGRWFGDRVNDILGFFWQLPGKVLEVFNSAVTAIQQINWSDIGMNIIKGIGNGMVNMGKWLADKAKAVVGEAKDQLKNFLGIHSPSRVMRDEVGKMLGLGIAEGIDASTKDAVKSAVNSASSILGAYGTLSTDIPTSSQLSGRLEMSLENTRLDSMDARPMHVTVMVGDDTLVNKVVNGINSQSFMTNGTVIRV